MRPAAPADSKGLHVRQAVRPGPVQRPDGALTVCTWGAGPRTVVAAHGVTASHAEFHALADALPDDVLLPLDLGPLAALPIGELLQAILGPAIDRLGMTFATPSDYLDYWRPHPALASAWSPYVERYIEADLVAEDGARPRGRRRSSRTRRAICARKGRGGRPSGDGAAGSAAARRVRPDGPGAAAVTGRHPRRVARAFPSSRSRRFRTPTTTRSCSVCAERRAWPQQSCIG